MCTWTVLFFAISYQVKLICPDRCIMFCQWCKHAFCRVMYNILYMRPPFVVATSIVYHSIMYISSVKFEYASFYNTCFTTMLIISCSMCYCHQILCLCIYISLFVLQNNPFAFYQRCGLLCISNGTCCCSCDQCNRLGHTMHIWIYEDIYASE